METTLQVIASWGIVTLVYFIFYISASFLGCFLALRVSARMDKRAIGKVVGFSVREK
jgi:hypothetical protein